MNKDERARGVSVTCLHILSVIMPCPVLPQFLHKQMFCAVLCTNVFPKLMSCPVLVKLLPSWCPILSNLLSELMVCPSCCYVCADSLPVFHTVRHSCLHIVDDRADFLSYSSWNLSRSWCPFLFFSKFLSELISWSTLLYIDFGAAVMILVLFDVTDVYCPVHRNSNCSSWTLGLSWCPVCPALLQFFP